MRGGGMMKYNAELQAASEEAARMEAGTINDGEVDHREGEKEVV